MELAGDEKKIQALFSELSLQDQSAAPAFEELWASAAMKASAPARSVSRPLLAVTVALLIVATSWAAWSWYRSTPSSHEQAINVSPQTVLPPTFQQLAPEPKPLTVTFKPRSNRPHKPRLHQPERPAITEAALLSSWQSPTRIFMQSPTAVNFSSLPQLNQSVEQLKQFLPRNTELTKESNQ